MVEDVMGAYYYYLSTKTKKVFINGVAENVGLIMFSHKTSLWDRTNKLIDARLAHNEKIWANRLTPRYVMHASISQGGLSPPILSNDPIFYWDKDYETHFPESFFMLEAGKLNIKDKSPKRQTATMQTYHTMVFREDMMYLSGYSSNDTIAEARNKRYETLEALREMIPSLCYQARDTYNETLTYIHCLSENDLSLVKLYLPTAQPIDPFNQNAA